MSASPLCARNGRVAVVIPVYHAGFLAEALESVFFQSRPPDEVIVIDDGSPDQAEIHQAVAPYADAVWLIRQPNSGAGAARNAGIAATEAEFIAFLDADDRWLPHFLRRQLSVLEDSPTVDLVYADGLFIGRSALAGRRYMAVCPSQAPVTFEKLLAQQCTVLLSSVVARRSAILRVGGFDPALRRGQDFDLWLRLARQGARIAFQDLVLTLRRMHDNNLGGTAINEIERPLRVFNKVVETMPLTDHEQQIVRSRIRALTAELTRERGKEMLRNGDWRGARRALLEACRTAGSWKLHAAVVGLHVAPHLMRRFYQARSAQPAQG